MTLYPVLILAVTFIIGMPVSFSMIISCIPYFFNNDSISTTVIMQKLISGCENASLTAIPFFIVSGSILNCSGIAERLLKLADAIVGHYTGGLGAVNVLVSTMMGGISGSGAADAASDCKYLVPEMVRHGYDKAYSGAVTAASAVITPIIPPGVGLIVYACIMEVSVGRLLAAGYVPGLLLCVGMLIANYLISKKRGYKADRTHMLPVKEILKIALESTWALFMPFGLIMALRVGICTPTEGGAMMALYALLVGKFIYKELDLKQLPSMLLEGAMNTATIMLIMAAANVLSFYMSWERIPFHMTNIIISIAPDKALFLLLSMALLIVLGMFMDGMAAMIVIAPLLAPVASQLGIDLVHYGLIMVFNSAVGAITPPFGNYLFLVAGTLNISTSKIYKEIIPYVLVCIIVLLICTYIPWLVTVIPNLLYGA